ncbi:YihD family protein [uncultured Ferrimonas sp.]|uniref:YihD family protein n=1 Tax=uncultured Ferrimonas sp. TaxID=432640 RepID=UPI002638187D|nr:YihD family protein [uncultured Ferrimonas sp.]
MSCHRIDELLELLEPVWQANQELNLAQMLVKLAKDTGFDGKLEDLTDDVLIYHLKMQETGEGKMIPGIAKDYVEDYDWKSAILKARGIDPNE